MKRALAITAVVALLETAFLLSFVVPSVSPFPTAYQAFVGWSQLVIIPGMAALFSRLIYGSQGWLRRAMRIILAGSFGFGVFLTVFLFVAAAIGWAASVNWALFAVLIVTLGGSFILGAVWIAGKIYRGSVPHETARWLEDRRRQVTANDRKWRNRGIGIAVWIPSLTVLLVGTFLVPIWGILSHVAQPQVGNLSRFRVPVPLTWVVLNSNRNSMNGYVWASGLVGQGSPLVAFFHTNGFAITEWHFRFQTSNESSAMEMGHWRLKDDKITGRRLFAIGDEKIECLEYLPSYLRRADTERSSTIFVECRSGRLSCGFTGESAHLPAFYRMLQSTKQLQ